MGGFLISYCFIVIIINNDEVYELCIEIEDWNNAIDNFIIILINWYLTIKYFVYVLLC